MGGICWEMEGVWLGFGGGTVSDKMAKLLLVEGALGVGEGFLPAVEAFLLCRLRGGTLVKPSASAWVSAPAF